MRFTLLVFISFSLSGFGQTITRQTISSGVGTYSNNGVVVQQTIGQPYQTKTNQTGDLSYRPGFQQPVFSTELISTTINVTILPNPALLSFFIQTSDTLFNTDLTIYDERGRKIYAEQIEFFLKHEVLCATWANGIYLVNITDNKNNLISTKLIKHQ